MVSTYLSHGTCQDVLHIFEEHGLPSDEVLRENLVVSMLAERTWMIC